MLYKKYTDTHTYTCNVYYTLEWADDYLWEVKERHSKTNGGVWTKNQEEVWNTVMLYVGYRAVLWSQSQGEGRATFEWIQWPHMKFLKWAKAVVLRMCLWISASCHKAAEVLGTQHCLRMNECSQSVLCSFFKTTSYLPSRFIMALHYA